MITVNHLDFALGEKEYHIPALGLAASERWRENFEQALQDVLSAMKDAGINTGDLGVNSLTDLSGADLTTLMPVISIIIREVNWAMDTVAGLVCSYGKVVEADYETIMESATMAQAVYALAEMVKAEYPFGQIAATRLKQSGPAGSTTSKN